MVVTKRTANVNFSSNFPKVVSGWDFTSNELPNEILILGIYFNFHMQLRSLDLGWRGILSLFIQGAILTEKIPSPVNFQLTLSWIPIAEIGILLNFLTTWEGAVNRTIYFSSSAKEKFSRALPATAFTKPKSQKRKTVCRVLVVYFITL